LNFNTCAAPPRRQTDESSVRDIPATIQENEISQNQRESKRQRQIAQSVNRGSS